MGRKKTSRQVLMDKLKLKWGADFIEEYFSPMNEREYELALKEMERTKEYNKRRREKIKQDPEFRQRYNEIQREYMRRKTRRRRALRNLRYIL